MDKSTFLWLAGLQLLITVGHFGTCSADEKDWPIGCFKESLSNLVFNISAGNYFTQVNVTAATCVEACSSLNNGYKRAGLTANGICLCSLAPVNASQTVANISCLFPSTEGLFLMVYPVVFLPNISVPESVLVFKEFHVTINDLTGPLGCSYVLDFDDGRQVKITNQNRSVTHVYQSTGSFMVKLSSEPFCLPEVVIRKTKARLGPVDKSFANVSLDCPNVVESTQKNQSCTLSVSHGSEVNATVDSGVYGILPDTVVESLGISPSLFHNAAKLTSPEIIGTYLFPQEVAKHDGLITAFGFHVYRPGKLTIQIFSPVCPADSKSCHGNCIKQESACYETTVRGCSLGQKLCLSHGRCNLSETCESSEWSPQRNVSPTNYTVRSVLTVDIKSNGYTSHALSSPLPILRGDVVGFRSSPSEAGIYFNDLNSTIVLFYRNMTFLDGQSVPTSSDEIVQGRVPHFRVYFYTTTLLLVNIVPTLPGVTVRVDVSSMTWKQHQLLPEYVPVQERISGLHVVSPNASKYYATKTSITFTFSVTKGSNISCNVDFGDGNISNIRNLDSFSHSYSERGNYSLKVNASNLINTMIIRSRVIVVNDVKDLTFTKNPEDFPGEKGVPYFIKFQLGAGDGVYFSVDSGRNTSVFLTCSNITDTNFSVNFSYPETGDYMITIVALSRYLHRNLTINSRVQILERIGNLTLEQEKDGKYIPLGDKMNPLHSDSMKIRVSVSSGTKVNYTFEASHKNFTIEETPPQFTFKFASTGVRNITVIARNGLNQVNRTFRVRVLGMCESFISLYDGRTKADPLRTTRGKELEFKVEERSKSNSDYKETTPCWTCNWKLSQADSGNSIETESLDCQKTFVIAKGKLNINLMYRVDMVATCNDTKRFCRSSGHTFAKVVPVDPVAVIQGGGKRDVAYKSDGELLLDASSSYDPDGTHFNSTGLLFDWTCLTNKSLVLHGKNSAKLKVKMAQLSEEKEYKFQVNVSTIYGNASASQVIRIVDKSVPTTEIICRVNCLAYVDVTERLSLEGGCANCSKLNKVDFKWSLAKLNGNKSYETVEPKPETFTGWDEANIVIKPKGLVINTDYQLKLIATRDNLNSSSSYPFRTSGKPSGGNCSIRPKTGTAAKTEFQVSCKDWEARFFPLTYSIRYQSSFKLDTKVSSLHDQNEDIRILWYHGQEQKSPSRTLPSGPEKKGYNLNVDVEIRDESGGIARCNLSVQVKPQNISLKDLEQKTSDLDKIDVKNKPQQLTQTVATLSAVLNHADSKDKDKSQETKQIRQNMVQSLSKIEADTLPLIKQTADAIKLATDKSSEVTHETQEIAATTLKKMSATLVEIASDPSKKSGQVIDETARILLSGLSKVLDAAFITGKELADGNAPKEGRRNVYGTLSEKGQQLEKIGDENKKVVTEVDKIIQDVNRAILKKKLIGEEPTFTNTQIFEMKLSKNRTKYVSRNKTVNNATGKFILPQVSELFANQEVINTELIAFKKNPYLWDIENSSFIQQAVQSLSFRSEEGEPIPVQNLRKDIEIFLPIEDKAIPYFPLKPSKDNPKLLVYEFSIKKGHFDETVVLNFDCSKASCQTSELKFFLRYGENVSESNFDFSHQLNKSCEDCHSIDIYGNSVFIREPAKLELNRGGVSVGILPCSSDGESEQPCDSVDYGVYVYSVSCRFWSQEESKWRRDGCKVGLKSLPSWTHCLCNHLTSFGSYIVKPNPLTKFSLDDFKRGYVTLVAVVSIFLLYLLILVWARKADGADVTKVGVVALADNNPQDRYRYEVAIWTGMRRNAGTESEVTLILTGDIHDSEPRRLVNPHKKGFQRGSLEKFLLTTSQDIGSLYCIRIWHDNSRGSWYLSRVMVTDLETDERYYFICDRWLAVDEDDGAVERLLPVASEDELVDFQHLFLSRTKRNLSDSHLWFSVLNRPPQSPFTRVQRLSCCLCILMMTMMANAMFYQSASEPKASSINFVGSYSFTWHEIKIGIQSTLIILPANIIILYIFRHIRPKPVKQRRSSHVRLNRLSPDHESRRAERSPTPSLVTLITRAGSLIGDEQENAPSVENPRPPEPKKKKKAKPVKKLTRWSRFKSHLPRLPSSLPYYFLYLAWPLLIILTLGSATVVVLYGMEFGNGRSLQWLFSIVVSICEDIFVLQPLKVFAFALAFALLVRKPDEGEFKIAGDKSLQDDEEFEVNPARDSNSAAEGQTSKMKWIERPDESVLNKMRKTRLKERKTMNLINEIIVHLMFIFIIALVTYGHKDTRAIQLSQNLDELRTKTSEIRNFPDLWNWTREVLIPKAFPDKLYNMESVPSVGFFDDGYNNLISRARLRLLRVNNDSCVIPDIVKNIIHTCAKDYSIAEQDEASYGEKWRSASLRIEDKPCRWCFKSRRSLDGYPYWGKFTTYSGSGYITELVPGGNNNDTANEMEKLQWLEERSRALFVEMTIYNANVNLFSSIMLLFEFPSFGGVFVSRNIQPMRLKVYVGGFSFFIFACEIVFVLFIVAYLYIAFKKMYRMGLGYFKLFWNVVDFAVVATSLSAIGIYIYRIGMTVKLMRGVNERDGEFVNFQYVTYWNEVYNATVAVVVALSTIKLTKLMRFNLRISLFAKTLKRASPALAMFSIQFGIVFFAFVWFGVLAFGSNVNGYKNIPSTMVSLGRVILGKNEFTEVPSVDPIIGPLFFFAYVFLVCWILMNMFLTILMESYHQVESESRSKSNEYELMDFLLSRFRDWSGFGKRKVVRERVPPARRWRNAKVKVKAVSALGHRRVYQQSAENVVLEKTADLMEKLEDSIRDLEKRINLL